MEFPGDRLYSEDHCWVKMENDNAVVGITHHAAAMLGPADYVELPRRHDVVARDMAFALVETSKAVTELLAPISGIVVNVNDLLAESPEAITDDPYGDGWVMTIQPSDLTELDQLISPSRYDRMAGSERSA